MESQKQHTGVIKFFLVEKGYGFIVPDEDQKKDYFFHFTGLVGTSIINKGQKVNFELKEGPRGTKAVNIQII